MVQFSRWCVPCGPSLRCNTTVGSTPSHVFKAIEINLSLREEIPAVPSVGQNHEYKWDVWGKKLIATTTDTHTRSKQFSFFMIMLTSKLTLSWLDHASQLSFLKLFPFSRDTLLRVFLGQGPGIPMLNFLARLGQVQLWAPTPSKNPPPFNAKSDRYQVE